MNANKLVVGLAGMPGSGKSVVVDTAREMGYDIVVMGDVITARNNKARLGVDTAKRRQSHASTPPRRRKRCYRPKMYSQN